VASLTLNRHDKGFDINFAVKDSDGNAYDLTAHTIEFHISDENYVTKLSKACVITDAAQGLCKYTLGNDDLDLEPGDYLGELELTTAGGLRITNVSKISIKLVEECG